MSAYRSHTCGELTAANAGSEIRLSGWVHRVRDHGGVLFIDLRDHYGITQVIADSDSPAFAALEKLRAETVIRITDTQYSKDVLSVNNTGRVAEYRLNYRISFSATHQGEPVLENGTLRLSRTLTGDEPVARVVARRKAPDAALFVGLGLNLAFFGGLIHFPVLKGEAYRTMYR